MELYQKRGGDLVQLVAPGIGADVPLSDAVDSVSVIRAADSGGRARERSDRL